MEYVKSFKQTKILKYFFIALIGSIVLAISSKIKIPFYPVPMTMQTFVVLFLGLAFGHKIGLATVTLYLLEGIFGLPVFANSPEKGIGLIYFTGPTMGYLVGFLFAAFLSGMFRYNNNILLSFFKLTISVSVIYFLGILWLGNLIGWDKPVMDLGVKPFLLAELFKISLLAIIISIYYKKIDLLKKYF